MSVLLESGDPAHTLLNADRAGFETDEGVEDGQDVAAVLYHAVEIVAQAGLALGFAVPLGQDLGGHFDIAAELVGGVATEKKPVEEGCFALRELEIPQGIFDDDGRDGHMQKRQFTESPAKVKGKAKTPFSAGGSPGGSGPKESVLGLCSARRQAGMLLN
jgi:hypothetical protein